LYTSCGVQVLNIFKVLTIFYILNEFMRTY
jgi:hypothetical protein